MTSPWPMTKNEEEIVVDNNDNDRKSSNPPPIPPCPPAPFNNACDFNLLPFSNNWPSSSGGGFALDIIIVSPEQDQKKKKQQQQQRRQQKTVSLNNNDGTTNNNGSNLISRLIPKRGSFTQSDVTTNIAEKNDVDSDSEEDDGGITASSDFFVEFPAFQQQQKQKMKKQQHQQRQQQKAGSSKEQNDDDDDEEKFIVLIQINNIMIDPLLLSMSLHPKQKIITYPPITDANNTNSNTHSNTDSFASSQSPSKIKTSKKQQFVFDQGKSTKPSSQVLSSLVQHEVIKPGRNVIQYILASYKKPNRLSKISGEEEKEQEQTKMAYKPMSTATAFIYSWNVNDKVIVVDIDGTVTKSDVRGAVSSIITEKYDHVHNGVCAFFSNIVNHKRKNRQEVDGEKGRRQLQNDAERNVQEQQQQQNNEPSSSSSSSGEIRVMYLSSRSIKLMDSTRKFLSQLSQSPDLSTDTNISAVIEYMSCLKSPSDQGDILDNDEEEYDFCKENNTTKAMDRSPIHSDSLGDNANIQFENNHNANVNPNSNPEKQKLSVVDARNIAEIYNKIKQPESFEMVEKAAQLPQGPIFLFTGSISSVLVMELIKKSAHKYKADTLIRQVVLPFLAAGKKKNDENDNGKENTISADYDSLGIFLAGFGNKHTDAMAYEMAGLLPQDIYIINKNSEVITTGHDDDDSPPAELIGSVNRGVDVGCFACLPKPSKDEMIDEDSSTSSMNNITTVYRPKKSNLLTKKLTFSGYDDPQLIISVINKMD